MSHILSSFLLQLCRLMYHMYHRKVFSCLFSQSVSQIHVRSNGLTINKSNLTKAYCQCVCVCFICTWALGRALLQPIAITMYGRPRHLCSPFTPTPKWLYQSGAMTTADKMVMWMTRQGEGIKSVRVKHNNEVNASNAHLQRGGTVKHRIKG